AQFHEELPKAGLSAVTALSQIFPSPLAAALGGALPYQDFQTRFDQPWKATVIVPPSSHGVMERSWIFPDAKSADEMFDHVARTYGPTFMETIPALDAGSFAATKLWRPHGRLSGTARGVGLRVVTTGPRVSRRAKLMEASWGIERAGGVCHHRTPSPTRLQLEALAAAAGAARLSLCPTKSRSIPEGSILATKKISLRGQRKDRRILWYIRDLAQSVHQAQEILALPQDDLPSCDQGAEITTQNGQSYVE
ncbi:MAG: hypothetical protein AAF723_08235, partial [Pseudomonadota bacterium]